MGTIGQLNSNKMVDFITEKTFDDIDKLFVYNSLHGKLL